MMKAIKIIINMTMATITIGIKIIIMQRNSKFALNAHSVDILPMSLPVDVQDVTNNGDYMPDDNNKNLNNRTICIYG